MTLSLGEMNKCAAWRDVFNIHSSDFMNKRCLRNTEVYKPISVLVITFNGRLWGLIYLLAYENLDDVCLHLINHGL